MNKMKFWKLEFLSSHEGIWQHNVYFDHFHFEKEVR